MASTPVSPLLTSARRKTLPTDGERHVKSWLSKLFVPLFCVFAGLCMLGALLWRWSSAPWIVEEGAPARAAVHYTRLIMVAGHSVFIGANASDYQSSEDWFLQPYQQVPGIVETFVEHIRMGVEAAAADSNALLIFSGGYTRSEAGSRSESGSYWMLADGANWFGHPEVKERAVVEDRARDSFENLLFSVCRFRQVSGYYPEKITIVSYELKRDRFVRLHAASLGFAENQISFLGNAVLNPDEAAKGEHETVQAFSKDPYGCKDPIRAKRMARDPFGFGGDVNVQSCPALKPFLIGCLPKTYKGSLPWRSGRKFLFLTLGV